MGTKTNPALGSGPKTYPAYGSGTINFSFLEQELARYGGKLLVHVVWAEWETGGARLKYGLFYQNTSQTVFDVVAKSTCQLKTYVTSDTVLRAVRELLGDVSIPIPTLDRNSAIAVGALRKI